MTRRSKPEGTGTTGKPNMEAWAAAYASSLGWPVFPLRPGDKVPLTRNGFKDASTDLDQILNWWRAHPEANIGLPTGIAFDVLDIDGDVGVAVLDLRLGERYHHKGPLSSTGKGWHLLFAATGKPSGTGLLEKVDYRGTGGYIVAPPSLHPSGHYYMWHTDRGPRTPLPVAPDWLLELLNHDDNPVHAKRPLVADADPNKPALDWMTLVRDQQYPADQLPHALRRRSERPSILEVCAAKGMILRRRGSHYVTTCIFHDDSTPSLAVYPADDTFHCYGCAAHGDSFDLQNDPPTHI
jgi:hypothetical protein